MARHNEASTQRAAPSDHLFQWKPLNLHRLQNVALFTPNPRGADGRQRWIRAVDLRLARGSQL